MRQLIEGLGTQMAEALKVSVTRSPSARKPFRGVVVLGMGGSGIGGAVLADMVRAISPMPVQAVSDQVLPGWVNADCLVVASSYSGNTEETLAALNESERRGCTLGAVTSGGSLGVRADEGGWPVVQMPGGNPPRSQFGRSFLGLCALLHAFEVLPTASWEALQRGVAQLDGASCAERGEAWRRLWKGRRSTSTETHPCGPCSLGGASS